MKHIFLATLFLSCSLTHLQSVEDVEFAYRAQNSKIPLLYLEKGEYYLSSGKFDKAVHYLEKGYELNVHVGPPILQEELELRFLFSLMIAYACVNEEVIALKIADYLQELLDNWECTDCAQIYLCQDEEYVIGSGDMPYDGWCEEAVTITSAALKGVIKGSPLNLDAKESILFTIDKLQVQARKCCAKGSPWKSCIGPLVKKLHEWKMIGTSADPMWD